jgi:DNA polymerase-3 subunit delta
MKEAYQIIESIKKGEIKPVYFLTGEESFFIDLISDFIEENVIPEEAKGFDQMILYGRDVDLNDLFVQARRFPMIGDRQVIIVKEAQHLFRKQQEYDLLEDYLNNPSPKTLLVFNYKHKKPDARKKAIKLLKKVGVYFETKRMYEREVTGWIGQTVKEMGYHIDAKSTQMLMDFLGTDLSKIYNELQKLQIILPQGTSITPEVIEKNIGISKDYNTFELKSAVAKGNYLKAQRIVNYFNANPKEHPLPVSLAVMYNFFRDLFIYHTLVDKSRHAVAKALKINPYFVSEYEDAASRYPMKKLTRIMSYLEEADLKSKGLNSGSMQHKDIMNELVFKIMH